MSIEKIMEELASEGSADIPTHVYGNTGIYGKPQGWNDFLINLASKMDVDIKDTFLGANTQLGAGEKFFTKHYPTAPIDRLHGRSSRWYQPKTGEMRLAAALTPYEDPSTKGHETGHLFDSTLGGYLSPGVFETGRRRAPRGWHNLSPSEQWQADPDYYNSLQNAQITGYKSDDSGSYEFEQMQDSWDRAGRTWTPSFIKGTLGSDYFELPDHLKDEMSSLKRELDFNKAKNRLERQSAKDRFLNERNKERFGNVAEPISEVVASALTDKTYQNKIDDIRKYDPEGYVYHNSPSERMAGILSGAIGGVQDKRIPFGEESLVHGSKLLSQLKYLL